MIRIGDWVICDCVIEKTYPKNKQLGRSEDRPLQNLQIVRGNPRVKPRWLPLQIQTAISDPDLRRR